MPVRLRGAPQDAAALSTACVYVGPRSRYTNLFRVGDRGPTPLGTPMDAAEAVDLFVATLRGPVGSCYSDQFARALRGFDLMCTCPLDVPCHADALLHLANESGDDTPTCTQYFPKGPR
ncbi:DUF4326 domain-containing protein [Streptomyces sp. SID10853]|uniref:DUF4326 domain-containing protein n=1 Tax=Streptomyces sp. SID10853 TaxID=2706028 RepID=UPI0013C1BD3C|nr:DUF4326 domain-containing protein [Streptomyces sp. SID10853]NDZ76967.1 DUF4326 domain-containing protein [Streptomyces sp. SID10853]